MVGNDDVYVKPLIKIEFNLSIFSFGRNRTVEQLNIRTEQNIFL